MYSTMRPPRTDQSSRIMTLLCAWSPSFSSSSAKRMICSSLRTSRSYASFTATLWLATRPIFLSSNSLVTRSSKYVPFHKSRDGVDIFQIIPSSYNNVAKRIKIPNLPDSIVPGSPEDIQIPVPPSGTVSPFSGLGTPQAGSGTATPQLQTPQPLQLRKTHINPSD